MATLVRPLPYRTPAVAETALHIHERAARAYRKATRALKSAPPDLRKARAVSQQPTALERLMYQLLRMRFLGAPIADLREIELEIGSLIDDLERNPAQGRLLALLRESKARGHADDVAELDCLVRAGSPMELRRLADAARAMGAIEAEVANEAEREARELEAAR